MAKTQSITIPSIPTKEVKFENGVLRFKHLANCAYSPSMGCFVGGEWQDARLRTYEDEPVWVHLDAGELVVEKLTDFLLDKKNGNFVGGRTVEIACFRIK